MQFTCARVAAGTFKIRKGRATKTNTSITGNPSFRLHLYASSPTPSNGDNGAWLTGVSGYLGAIDFIFDRAFTDVAYASGLPATGNEINVVLASSQVIYGLVEARSAYTPTAQEVFTFYLDVYQS